MRGLNFNYTAAADILRYVRENDDVNSEGFCKVSGWSVPNGDRRSVTQMLHGIQGMYDSNPELMAELVELEGIGPGEYNGSGRGLYMTAEEVEEAESNAMLDALVAAIDNGDYVPPVTVVSSDL